MQSKNLENVFMAFEVHGEHSSLHDLNVAQCYRMTAPPVGFGVT